jgi:PD-(D/E)XK endonuclease
MGRDFHLRAKKASKMKNRRKLGCLIKGKKERGAWAELYFMVLAMSQGLRVSSPYGAFGPYDVGVEVGIGPILRVQVKCTVYEYRGGGHSVNVFGPKRSQGRGIKRGGYAPGTVDFFALYIIPTDDWYIIPYAVIGDKSATLNFAPGSERHKYGKYQEAWHLLLNAAKSLDKKGLDIRACSDDENTELSTGELMSGEAVRGAFRVRRMFRGLFKQ